MFKYTTDAADCATPEIMQTLDELVREGARHMIAAALELKVAEYIEKLRCERDARGHASGGAKRKSSGKETDLGGGKHQA
jgi:hypothetical protein